jgi:hypothetical protein
MQFGLFWSTRLRPRDDEFWSVTFAPQFSSSWFPDQFKFSKSSPSSVFEPSGWPASVQRVFGCDCFCAAFVAVAFVPTLPDGDFTTDRLCFAQKCTSQPWRWLYYRQVVLCPKMHIATQSSRVQSMVLLFFTAHAKKRIYVVLYHISDDSLVLNFCRVVLNSRVLSCWGMEKLEWIYLLS